MMSNNSSDPRKSSVTFFDKFGFPEEKATEMIELSALTALQKENEQLKTRLGEAEKVVEFYADKNNWLRDENGWRHDMIADDLDDPSLKNWDGRFSGKRAREYFKKWGK